MDRTKVFSLIFGVFSLAASAQETAEKEVQIAQPFPKLSYLDSIKATFVYHETSNCIDEMWMKELNNQDLFNEMQSEIAQVNSTQAVSYDLPTDLLKQRLSKLDEKSPFHVEYNPTVENVIKSFLKNRPRAFERLMALSEYYFPMFEASLSKYDLPLEIKYLAIVESALNPLAKSRVGASGLWQFMYETGKQYNLEVNSYVDERYDPLKSTEAACQYFTNMYRIFGDWDLVLASYNTGPGNISKAIRRSGGHTNYWNIRKHMHPETQGYLPAFYATMYIYEYRKEHGIVPKKASVTYFETDTVMVKRQMSFKQLADLLDMPEEQLRFLNPIYKRNVVPFVSDKAHYIRLPKNKLAIFTSNEDKVYAYVDYEESKREKQQFRVKTPRTILSDTTQTAIASNTKVTDTEKEEVSSTPLKKTKIKYYTVKRGDNLSEIAEKNNVSTAELKKWNKIKGSGVNAGQKLKIQYETTVMVADRTAKKKNDEVVKVSEPVVKTEEPKANVEAVAEKIYVVQNGDNLTRIAAKNNVTTAQLKEWNHLEDEGIRAGQELKIQASENVVAAVDKEGKKEVAKSSKERSLEREYMTYVVQKGDSLISISKKKGTTVEAIRKLNDIKGDDIRPGMKLKING